MKKQIDTRKMIVFIVAINIIQIVAMSAITAYSLLWDMILPILTQKNAIFVLLLFSVLSTCLTVVNVLFLLQMHEERTSLQSLLENTETLNRTLRTQRHDFLNQLQVVYSLIELEDYQSANAYIEKIYDDIQRVSSILKTDHAALNAILQAKVSMCRSRNIEIRTEINSRFTDVEMPIWQLCRVFGNIIDNAVFVLTETRRTDGRITVTLSETLKGYYFRISNNGPMIPPAVLSKIFDAGFTTKHGEGHGMGLTICRTLMDSYGGSIQVSSTASETIFEGFLLRSGMREKQ